MSTLKFAVLFCFIFNMFNLFSMTGIVVKTSGTFLDKKSRAKILNLILHNPADLLTDTSDLDLEIDSEKKE